jgi:drug/metabolite transporter (DMT)-like permease
VCWLQSQAGNVTATRKCAAVHVAGRTAGNSVGVGVVLGLLAALAYGSSDFVAGVGGRRSSAGRVTLIAQPFGLVAAAVALALFRGAGPSKAALLWGSLSGVGSGIGTISLYQGLAVGRMSVVAPLSAVLTAVLPAIVGLATGERLSAVGLVGLGVAVPAVALVSWQPHPDEGPRSGARFGVLAGCGFALLFIALDRAGTQAGAWPLLPGQAVAVLVILFFALRVLDPAAQWRRAAGPGVVAGVLGGTANLLFLAAAGAGQLAVVAVLTALYPAVTIVLARGLLGERWTRRQAAGLIAAGIAVGLISAG